MPEMPRPTGKHLIAGEWTAGSQTFASTPVSGDPLDYALGGPAEIDRAVTAAEEAFRSYGYGTRQERATFLEAIAEEIEARAEALTAIGSAETGLPEARLENERGRTTGQLQLFADHIRKGDYLDRRHDPALPDRKPLPRPDLRMIQRPIGPVGVFGASNFPLAFSVAGGDTASALAAGCPVVVKGHPGHPGTGDLVAQAIDAAIRRTGMPAGTFSFVQSNTNEAGAALVQHPLIRAVGFTGSLRGGKALFDLACRRDEPIPFFGELGSINPLFALPEALKARGTAMAGDWAASLTMGVGQFCTNPGVVFLIDGPDARGFINAAREALQSIEGQAMLDERIAAGFRSGVEKAGKVEGIEALLHSTCDGRMGAPALFSISGKDWLAHPELAEEMFGPAGIVVRVADTDELMRVTEDLAGQLTCTLQMDDGDIDLARGLMPVLERTAGRILANGFPTGVEVAEAMVHGGPYPATTNFGATSVGTLAIRRFLRPVCFQNLPRDLLPQDLRD